MGNRGRHQSDREAGVREFLDLERNSGDQERKHTEDLGDRQLNLEVRREPKMDNAPSGPSEKENGR